MAGIQMLPPQQESGWGQTLSGLFQGGIEGYQQNQQKQKSAENIKKFTTATDDLGKLQALLSMNPEDRKSIIDFQTFQNEFKDLGDDFNAYGPAESTANQRDPFSPMQSQFRNQGFGQSPLDLLNRNEEAIPLELQIPPDAARRVQSAQAPEQPQVDKSFPTKAIREVPNDPRTWSDDRVARYRAERTSKNQAKKQRAALADTEFDRRKNEAKISSQERIAERKMAPKEREKLAEEITQSTRISKRVSDAKELSRFIDNSEVSFDENFIRGITSALLEGNESNLADIVKTPDQQKFFSLIRPLLNIKEIGGSNPSTREVLIELQSQPSIYKRKDANQYIAGRILNAAKTDQYMNQLIKKYSREKDLTPDEISLEIDEKVSKYRDDLSQDLQEKIEKTQVKQLKQQYGSPKSGHVWVRDPQGRVREIPRSAVKGAEANGGTIVGR